MDNTKKLLRALQAEAMLTESCDLRAYLTGFFSSFGYVYTDWEESVFFTDPRYAEGAKEALKGQDTKVEIAKSAASVFDYIKTKKVKKLAVPMERVSVPEAAVYKKYKFKLTDSMPAFVEAMSVKTDEEMQNVAAACEIAERRWTSCTAS